MSYTNRRAGFPAGITDVKMLIAKTHDAWRNLKKRIRIPKDTNLVIIPISELERASDISTTSPADVEG